MITILPCIIVLSIANENDIMNFLNFCQILPLPFIVIPLMKFASSEYIMQGLVYSKFKTYFISILFIVLQFINYQQIIEMLIDPKSNVSFKVIGWMVLLLYTMLCLAFFRLGIQNERLEIEHRHLKLNRSDSEINSIDLN